MAYKAVTSKNPNKPAILAAFKKEFGAERVSVIQYDDKTYTYKANIFKGWNTARRKYDFANYGVTLHQTQIPGRVWKLRGKDNWVHENDIINEITGGK